MPNESAALPMMLVLLPTCGSPRNSTRSKSSLLSAEASCGTVDLLSLRSHRLRVAAFDVERVATLPEAEESIKTISHRAKKNPHPPSKGDAGRGEGVEPSRRNGGQKGAA